ncbi:MAG: hypothetical protein IPJ16_16000 [Bacteroidales bacterium]|nr:hypothetical protein [Bacteroidales bacterium]
MKRLKIVYKILVTFIILIQITFSTKAQDNTLYMMPGIPQANQLNPAYMHPCRIYIGLPVISALKVNVRNTGFGFHDAIHTGTGAQSGTYYLDLENLDRKLKRMNYFRTDLDIDLLGFGFNLKDWYFTFGIRNHTELRVAYSDDVASLKDGNWDVAGNTAIPVKLSGTGADLTVWNSIGFSAARELFDGLKVGARIKYLQGMANINTKQARLELNTTNNPISLEAIMNYRLNASFPVNLGYDANGLVNRVDFDNALDNIVGDYIFNGNRGISIDGGIVYDLDESTQLTASFTDLGFIRWKKNVNNFKASGTYTFNGIDLDQYQANPGQKHLLEALQDTLLQAFTAAGTTQKYFTATSLKIYGGVTRVLLPKLKAGAMTRIEIYDLRLRPSLTLSMNYTPIPSVGTALTYTIMNNKINQVGAGVAFGNKGAQFYLITDNIPVRFTRETGSGLMWPYNARMLSLRLGFNLLFGCNEKEVKKSPRKPGKNELCPAYW